MPDSDHLSDRPAGYGSGQGNRGRLRRFISKPVERWNSWPVQSLLKAKLQRFDESFPERSGVRGQQEAGNQSCLVFQRLDRRPAGARFYKDKDGLYLAATRPSRLLERKRQVTGIVYELFPEGIRDLYP